MLWMSKRVLSVCAWYDMLWVSSMDRVGWRHKTNSTREREFPCFSPECRWIGADSMLLTISLVVPDLKSSKSMVDIKRRSNKAKLLKLKNQTFEVTSTILDAGFAAKQNQESSEVARAGPPKAKECARRIRDYFYAQAVTAER